MDVKKLYFDHLNLMRKFAWKIREMFGIEFDDALSQCFVVFSEALLKYDPSRQVKFSTFLYSQLKKTLNTERTANSRFRFQKCNSYSIDQLDDQDSVLQAFIDYSQKKDLTFLRISEFYALVETQLSGEAKTALQYILSKGEKQTFLDLVNQFKKIFQWSKPMTWKVWCELRDFWVEYSADFAL